MLKVQGDGVDAEQNDVADDGDDGWGQMVILVTTKKQADEVDEGRSGRAKMMKKKTLEENVAQDGGVDPEEILEMKKDSNVDEDSADEDTQDEEDEKAEAFANEKGDEAEGEDGVVVGDQVAAAEPGQDAAKGFLNAGNDRVDVASPGEENADQNEEEEGKTDDEMQDDESDEKDQAQAAQKQQAEVVPGSRPQFVRHVDGNFVLNVGPVLCSYCTVVWSGSNVSWRLQVLKILT